MTNEKLLKVIQAAIAGRRTSLKLENNKITELPVQIGELSNLVDLDMSHNELEHLPTEIKYLKKLKRLGLDYQKFTSFPMEICSLEKLREFVSPWQQLNRTTCGNRGYEKPYRTRFACQQAYSPPPRTWANT